MDGVVALAEQAPLDDQVQAPLRAAYPVPRDGVIVAHQQRSLRRLAARAAANAAVVHLHLQARLVRRSEGDAQRVVAARYDVVQVEAYLPCRRHHRVTLLAAAGDLPASTKQIRNRKNPWMKQIIYIHI